MNGAPAGRELAVLGGTGFLGRHFIDAARRAGRRIRMLVRDERPEDREGGEPPSALVRISGDLDDTAALARLITPGCTVVNFVWNGAAAPADAVRQARQLAAVCRDTQVHRLLHCSTAAVFGGCSRLATIDDDTAPRPADEYGRRKLCMDQALQAELEGRVPLALLRPTSVFGAGGLGLVKLAADIAAGGGAASYLRSCLFERRLMHLVPVETVAAAFLFVEAHMTSEGTQAFLVASDDEPLNQYRAMEMRLMQLLEVPDHRWPRLPLPSPVLRLMLRATGRAKALAFTRFDDRRLRALGFRPPVAFDAAVAAFAAWYRAQTPAAGKPPARATNATDATGAAGSAGAAS